MPPHRKRPATGDGGPARKAPQRAVVFEGHHEGFEDAPLVSDWVRTPVMGLRTAPDWASHMVRLLVRDSLLQRAAGKSVTLQVWSDCSGMATEMFAARHLSEALMGETGMSVKWNLFCACEKDKRARDFMMANHAPMHVSDDITHRNFVEGKFWCEKCETNHPLPDSGIDVYIAGYPCSPWSRKGLRTDFSHPEIQPFLVGMKTVNALKPAVWLMETTEGVDDHRGGAETSALDLVLKYIKETVNVPYVTQVVRNVTPAWAGYPIRRPRVFILNWRNDVGDPGCLGLPLQCVMSEPVPLGHNYWSLLCLQRCVDWTRVDQYPNQTELGALRDHETLSSCKCSVDPMVVCPTHPCPPTCKMCGPAGNGCLWRQKMKKFLESCPHLVSPGKLTYLQVLELHGLRGPVHPRQRNCLNVFALLPKSQPLNDTLAVVDLSQSIDMRVLQFDGSIPTLAKNSAIFCLQAGRFLTTPEKAYLMGFKTDNLAFPAGCSEGWYRERLGLCIHVASMGAMLLSLVAVPLNNLR